MGDSPRIDTCIEPYCETNISCPTNYIVVDLPQDDQSDVLKTSIRKESVCILSLLFVLYMLTHQECTRI